MRGGVNPIIQRTFSSVLTPNAPQDIITDDELISDSYDLKEIDGVVYEADCAKITIGGESFDTGANASAEEGGDDVDDNKETKIDVVHSFRLNETQFDKKAYLGHLKRAYTWACKGGLGWEHSTVRLADSRYAVQST